MRFKLFTFFAIMYLTIGYIFYTSCLYIKPFSYSKHVNYSSLFKSFKLSFNVVFFYLFIFILFIFFFFLGGGGGGGGYL